MDERHTQYSLEVRYEDGEFITQHLLSPVSHHHTNRDLAILHLDSSSLDKELQLLKDLGVAMDLELSQQLPLSIGQVSHRCTHSSN